MTTATTTLQVTFVSESAGYQNTFGWYNKVTGMGGILFADVEAEGRHAPLTPGLSTATFSVDTADVGNIAFFLIPDGHNQNAKDPDDLTGAVKVIQLSNGSWAVADVDSHGNVITEHGKPDILNGAGANALFTETSKNAGGVDYASSTVGPNQTAATLAGDTADGPTGQIAWEDLAATKNKHGAYSTPGDADYNDAVFNVSIVGGNHAPVAQADAISVGEDAGPTTINVLANDTDPDAGNVLHVSAVNAAGVLGTVTIAANGSNITYTPAVAYQALAEGETATETFTYTIADQSGATSTSQVTVTVVGANDAPTVAGAVAGAGNEGTGNVTVNLLASASDIDHGAVLHVANVIWDEVPGNLPAGFTVVGNAIAVDTNSLAYNQMAVGETFATHFTYDVVDEHGASVTQHATVNITGTNDAPTVAGAVAGAGNEGTGNVTVNLLASASDIDHGAVLHVANVIWDEVPGNLPAGFTVAGNTITVDTDSLAYNRMAVGETFATHFTYDVVDEHGASVTQHATVNITGTNDAPVVSSAVTGGGAEGSGLAGVDLLEFASDVDNVAVLQVANVIWDEVPGNLPAGFAVVGNTITVDTDSFAYNQLAVGETFATHFTYDVVDEHGASVTQHATVNITGANDAPVVVADTNGADAAIEAGVVVGGNTSFPGDPLAVGNVLANDGDPDQGDVLAVAGVAAGLVAGPVSGNVGATVSGAYGTLTLGVNGNWTYALNDSKLNTDSLAQGEIANDVFTYTVSDGNGGFASTSLSVAITGTNDKPVITGGATAGSITEDGATNQLTGQLNVADIDHGATQTWTVLGGTPSGNADYHFRADSFTITRFGSPLLQDGFSDGNPPPNSPNFIGNPNPTTYAGLGSFGEANGKLLLDSNNAVSFVGVGSSDPIVGQDAIARTNLDSASSAGLKLATPFTIESVFDLILPDSPREEYGIRATDRLIGGNGTPPDQLGNDVIELVVRENLSGALTVALRRIDFAANTTTLIESIALNSPPGADQIHLKLDHAANGQTLGASFDYLQGGVVVGSQTFSHTPTIFNGENWTRGEILALAPATSDSTLGGTYGTLNANQSGAWNYLFDNSKAATQALAQGQHAIDTFTVKVADQYGAFDTKTVTIDVTGTNDAPVMQTAAVSRALTEDQSGPNLTATGLAQFSDVDLTDTHSVGATLQSTTLSGGGALPGDLGTLLTSAMSVALVDPSAGDGHGQVQWDLALANSALQFLAQDQTLTLVYNVNIADPFGATASQAVTVTIGGVNDAPVITGATTAYSTEDALPLWTSGQLTATDPDQGATQIWSIAGGSPTSQDYNFALDEFRITRNGNPFFDDTFSDGVAPPSAPSIIGGGPVSYGVGSPGASFFENDGRALLVGTNGTLSPALLDGFPRTGQSATLLTDSSNNLNGAGLKKDMAFTVEGRFDLTMPTDVLDQYAIRLSDNTGANTGDNTVSLAVRRDADGVHVNLSELNFASPGVTVLEQFDLNPAAGDDQIVLRLDHSTANSTDIIASFDLVHNDVVTSTTNFTVMGHAFDNENWAQAQFVANGLPEQDSVLQGTYSTLTIDQNGDWTARVRNGRPEVQALAQGETVSETFNVQVADDKGAVTTQPVTVYVTGTNDAPVITGGATSGMVGEDGVLHATGALTMTDVDHGATHTWSMLGGNAGHVTHYHVTMDEFTIVKSIAGVPTIVFDDPFTGTNPPTAPPAPLGQLTSPGYLSTNQFTNADGRVVMDDAHAGIGFSISDPSLDFTGLPTGGIGNWAQVGTNIDPLNTTMGLKSGTSFTISGVYDLVSSEAGYGIRLANTNGATSFAGNDVVDFNVRTGLSGLYVQLTQIDFVGGSTVPLQIVPLSLSSGDDQILLQLTNDAANNGTIQASFTVLNHGVTDYSFDLTATGHLFDHTNWTRAGFEATASGNTSSFVNGIYGALAINQSGNWTYQLANSQANVQALAQGETVTDPFQVQVADQFGAISSTAVNITVTGTNDAPVMQTAPDVRSLIEDSNSLALTANGLAQFSDADLTDMHVVSAALQSATLSSGASLPVGLPFILPNAMIASLLDPATGDGHGQVQWNFALTNSETQFLAQGETLALDYHVNIIDSFGASAFEDVAINVSGVNDAPVIAGPSNIDLGPLLTGNGPTTPGQPLFELANNISFSDADYSDVHIVGASFNPLASSSGAPLGTMTATLLGDTTIGTGGLVHWSYLIDPAALNSLPTNTLRHESFDITIDDGHGGGAIEHVALNIGSGVAPMSVSNFTTVDYAGAVDTYANGINNSGQIVGHASLGAFSLPVSAVGWELSSGVYSTIAYPGAHISVANAINNYGAVAGQYEPFSSTPRYGFIESGGIVTQTLSLPPGASTTEGGINDAGVTVGSSYFHNSHQYSSFVDIGGAITYFDAPLTPSGGNTFANGINNLNQIVGSYTDSGGKLHGFLDVAGVFTTIDDPFGANGTLATKINNAGQIVGWYNDGSNKPHGFIDTAGVFTTVDNPLGTNGTVVEGMSDAGQIVGYYIDSSSHNHGFVADLNNPSGQAGKDVLVASPQGGTLSGGAGNDTFVFNAPSPNATTIVDFTHGQDMLQFSAAGFGHGLATGATPTLFTGALASIVNAGTDGVFVFDNTNPAVGTLYYDADGGSATNATAVAHLTSVTSLLPSDFHVV